MKENIKHLHERIKHFQSLIDYMSGNEKKYYLEKDWFDNPTLISIEDAKKEVEQAQKMLELLPRRSVKGVKMKTKLKKELVKKQVLSSKNGEILFNLKTGKFLIKKSQ